MGGHSNCFQKRKNYPTFLQKLSLSSIIILQCLYFNCRRRTRSAASTSLLIEPEPSGREPSVSRSLYDVQEEQEHRIPEASDIQPPEVILPAQILEEVTVDPAKAVEALLRYRISSVIRRTFFLPKQSQRSRSIL